MLSQANIEQNKKGGSKPGNWHELANFYDTVNKRPFSNAM
jgi:hypothetical protein